MRNRDCLAMAAKNEEGTEKRTQRLAGEDLGGDDHNSFHEWWLVSAYSLLEVWVDDESVTECKEQASRPI